MNYINHNFKPIFRQLNCLAFLKFRAVELSSLDLARGRD